MNPPPEIRFTLNRLDLLDWTWGYVLRSRVLLAMSLLSAGFVMWTSHRADDAGLHASSHRGQSTVTRGTFERVRHGRRGMFLCLTSSQGIVIPHRAFPRDDDRRAFEAFCAGRIARAQDEAKAGDAATR